MVERAVSGSLTLGLRRAGVPALLLSLAPFLAMCGGGSSAPTPWTTSVPKATCGTTDRPETGLQGQTTLAERTGSPSASETAFTCNLQLVSQVQDQGAQWQLTWFNDCAYFGTYDTPEKTNPGTVVVDITNPADPTFVENIATHPSIYYANLHTTQFPGGATRGQLLRY